MKTLVLAIVITLVICKVAPPIAESNRKWVHSSQTNNDCRKDCAGEGGHVCVGLHKSVCCDRHWCVKDEKLYDIWNCRKGFEIHVDSCNDFPKRDAGFLELQAQE